MDKLDSLLNYLNDADRELDKIHYVELYGDESGRLKRDGSTIKAFDNINQLLGKNEFSILIQSGTKQEAAQKISTTSIGEIEKLLTELPSN